MASNETSKYKLSVVEGTELQLSVNTGVQGPAGPQGEVGPEGPAGPNEITTSTSTNLTGFIYGDGTNVAGAVDGLFDNSHINFAAPDPIGSGTPNTGAFTTLSATGTATLPHIHGSLAGDLYIHVKNTSGVPLTRGTPVYIVGNVGDTDRVQIAAADNTDPAKMPAVGLLDQDLANNGEGDAVILGELPAANTNAYTLNQELFVGVGALTGTKPTTGEVQSVGVVSRVQSNSGVIVVNMQGRRKTDVTAPTADTIALRNTTGGINAKHIRLHGDTYYAQINPTTLGQTQDISLNLPTSAGTIATNNTAVMLSGEQTAAGAKTFSGQMELTGQSATNGTSALTRDLGDARYGATYVGIRTETYQSTDAVPFKLTSVTLPIGMYQIDSVISATASGAGNGGYLFGLRSSSPIRTSLLDFFGSDNSSSAFVSLASDSTTLSQRSFTLLTATTYRRCLNGLIEVLTNNTEISIEFCQFVATPLAPNTTRKRSYIIARKIA
jgi:hypothetical protein